MTDFFGYIGAFLTTISFLPQVIHTIKTRDTSGISLTMYSMFVTGVFFWLLYSISLANLIMIAANSITLLLSVIVLLIKISNVWQR